MTEPPEEFVEALAWVAIAIAIVAPLALILL